MLHRPPQPQLVGLIVLIAPHFVHFCSYKTNFHVDPCSISPVFQVLLVDLPGKFLRFFNTDVTVSLEMPNTRPVSRVPAPFIAISTIFSLIPGRQALFLYSTWNVLWLHALFRHKYRCLPVLFFPYNDTSLLPQYGHTTSITAISFSPFFPYSTSFLSPFQLPYDITKIFQPRCWK